MCRACPAPRVGVPRPEGACVRVPVPPLDVLASRHGSAGIAAPRSKGRSEGKDRDRHRSDISLDIRRSRYTTHPKITQTRRRQRLGIRCRKGILQLVDTRPCQSTRPTCRWTWTSGLQDSLAPRSAPHPIRRCTRSGLAQHSARVIHTQSGRVLARTRHPRNPLRRRMHDHYICHARCMELDPTPTRMLVWSSLRPGSLSRKDTLRYCNARDHGSY